jgi:ribosome modulation factor
MKRQKRDPLGRAYQKGYMAGLEGRSKSLCPEGKPEIHQEWMNGWREVRSDQWDGFTGVRGIHRINEILMPH